VRVSLMSVNGVASVEVSLDKGLATVRLKPGNSVTLKQLQQAITKNGFTMKDSKIVAAGKLIHDGNARKLQVSGSEEILALIPESSASATPDSTPVVVEGTVPEAAKGRVPDAIRYRSLTPEK
jgi:copper chaperone CopZ